MAKEKRVATISIKNCTTCPHHEVRADPDPDDWFCDDDVKVYCKKADRNVTVGCRPYNVEKESTIPSWCPLLK